MTNGYQFTIANTLVEKIFKHRAW